MMPSDTINGIEKWQVKFGILTFIYFQINFKRKNLVDLANSPKKVPFNIFDWAKCSEGDTGTFYPENTALTCLSTVQGSSVVISQIMGTLNSTYSNSNYSLRFAVTSTVPK
jgi:hypothetical protein